MRRFANELGNTIEIGVCERDIEGVKGVFLSITGPRSMTEIHITHEEASVLSEELKQVLD